MFHVSVFERLEESMASLSSSLGIRLDTAAVYRGQKMDDAFRYDDAEDAETDGEEQKRWGQAVLYRAALPPFAGPKIATLATAGGSGAGGGPG